MSILIIIKLSFLDYGKRSEVQSVYIGRRKKVIEYDFDVVEQMPEILWVDDVLRLLFRKLYNKLF